MTKTIKRRKTLSPVFIINCVSLASLNTSRDIFQESLHINVSTYHCLYYLLIDKKVFTIFRARTSNKVQHECIYCGSLCPIKCKQSWLAKRQKEKKFLEEKIWSTHLTTLVNIDIQKVLSWTVNTIIILLFSFPSWLEKYFLGDTHLFDYLRIERTNKNNRIHKRNHDCSFSIVIYCLIQYVKCCALNYLSLKS